MIEPIVTLFIAIGAFGWGMFFSEWKTNRKNRKEKERRIIVDAPFLPEQGDAIIEALKVLNASVQSSMQKEVNP